MLNKKPQETTTTLHLGRAEQINQTLFKISNAVRMSKDLEELYGSIHHILAEIMDVSNFFISRYNKEKTLIRFPYYKDIYDDEDVYCDEVELGNSLTGGVIAKAAPVFLLKEELLKRRESNTLIGTIPEQWLGVPLKIKDEVIGVMATMSYHDPELFDRIDLNTLVSVSDQIALAIERKQYEQALSSSESKYRSILENMVEGYCEQNAESIITLANPAMCKILEKPVEEVVGKQSRSFLEDAEAEKILSELQSISGSHDSTKKMEFELILPNNKKKYLEGTFYLTLDENVDILGVSGIIRDITEKKKESLIKKKLEEKLQQSQKLESLGTLAGGIAHDFNNLLMGIQGRISIIQNDLEDQHPHFAQLEKIESHIERASNLTAQLLGFARGGKYEIKTVCVNKIITDSVGIVQPAKKELKIDTVFESEQNPVEVDKNQMEQVFVNLLLNASKAIKQSGTITVATKTVEIDTDQAAIQAIAPGHYVQITVEDTGRGINKDAVGKIFDPFFTTDSKGGSTGLGLAMVYGIVENHQGQITVKSELNIGTRFTVLLPLSQNEIVTKTTLPLAPKTGSETILLVDDEPMITDVGGEMISMLGYKVVTASSGTEALEIVEAEDRKFDLLIIDMIMPQISGGKLFDMLIEKDPDVKILLSSGYSIDGEAREILDRGCKGFIQKPFTVSQLGDKIRDILEDK